MLRIELPISNEGFSMRKLFSFFFALAVTVGVSVSAFGQGFNGGCFNCGCPVCAGGGGGGTVTLDAAEASPFTLSGTGGTDSGFTVGAGSNQLLVLLVSQGGSANAPSATWDGVSLTNVATITNGSIRSDILVLKAPAQGNKALVISSSGFSFSNSIACSFNGVDQTTPTQNSNTSTSSSITVTTSSGNATVVALTASGSLSAVDNIQLYANSTNGTGAARQSSSSASTTYTPTASGSFAFAGIDLKAL
jgi:hypothetical protein